VALERNLSPLPVGIYWIAVQEQKFPGFDAWMKTSPFVKYLKAESERSGPGSGVAPFAWILFEVEHPTNMPGGFGFPNIAEKGRDTKRDDTIDEPPPASIFDEFPTLTVADVELNLGKGAIVLGVALLLAILYSKTKGSS